VHAFIVTSSTLLFKDKITGEIPDMVQQEPWWWSNKSSTLVPIKTLQSCSQQDDRKQRALCLCNPPASVRHLRLQIPQVCILILWATNYVLYILSLKKSKKYRTTCLYDLCNIFRKSTESFRNLWEKKETKWNISRSSHKTSYLWYSLENSTVQNCYVSSVQARAHRIRICDILHEVSTITFILNCSD
jgi:hypothetical protein